LKIDRSKVEGTESAFPGPDGLGRAGTKPAPTAVDLSGSNTANPIDLDPRQLDHHHRVELRVLSAIRRIIRCVGIYSKELTTKAHITAPQLVCLVTLVEKGPMTATTISREVFLSPSTIVGILDRLEEKGLVKRERATKDRRVVTVTATEEGQKLAQSAPSPLQQKLTDSLMALPLNEQVDIARSLERVVNLMEAQHIDAAPILEAGQIIHTKSTTDSRS